ADDTHYDPQVMGHGLTNALRGVEAASNRDGLAAYHFTASGIEPDWMAGTYRGTAYPSFTNLLSPGGSSTDSFSVENHNGAAGKTVDVSDWELRRIGESSWTIIEAFVPDPLARIHDRFLLGIQNRTVSALVPSTTLTVTVDYYQALDAPWLTESASSLSLAAGGVGSVDVTVSVPASQPFGILSGTVVLTDTSSGAETLIPVVAQVAATG